MISNMGWPRRRRGGESARRSGPIRSRAGRRNRLSPAVLILEDRRLMTTVIPITSALDTGPGTLRDAIIQANSTAGRVEIDFQLPNGATIGLTQGQLELSDTGGPVSIVGPGAGDLTIDAGGASRVLQIDPGVTAMVSGLTLSGGWTTGAGGGVHNRGTVTLSDVVLSGNTGYTGGGMENDGTATLVGCTISGNTGYNFVGGGVDDDGTLRMVDSTISGDTGIWALTVLGHGIATLDDCLVSANSYNGILDQNSTAGSLTLTGTTISDHPGVGVQLWMSSSPVSGGPATGTLTDCTVSGNGHFGVWDESGTLLMNRCTISGNDGAGLLNYYGTAYLTACTISGNQGPGVQNGANITLTRCRITGNSAFMGGGVLSSPYYPDQSATLIDCIISQNSATHYGGGVDAFGSFTMRDCTVTGNVSGSLGGGVRTGGSATISGCLFAGNSADDDGGGIDVFTGHLTISDSLVTDNHAGGRGGGLNVNGDSGWWGGPGSATLTSLIVAGNSAASGGGIFVGGALAADGVQLVDNLAVDGGGIANAGTLTLDGSSLVGNTASHDGGGLLNHATARLTRCSLSANRAGVDGGGLFDDGLAALADCTITGNSAADGGGVYAATGGTVTLAQTRVGGNRGGDIGGRGSVT